MHKQFDDHESVGGIQGFFFFLDSYSNSTKSVKCKHDVNGELEFNQHCKKKSATFINMKLFMCVLGGFKYDEKSFLQSASSRHYSVARKQHYQKKKFCYLFKHFPLLKLVYCGHRKTFFYINLLY